MLGVCAFNWQKGSSISSSLNVHYVIGGAILFALLGGSIWFPNVSKDLYDEDAGESAFLALR